MHGLKRTLLIRTVCRGKASTAADIPKEEVVQTSKSEEVAPKAANASTVYRPPYYRKPHKYHESSHILQEEFANAGDASGAGVRLFDYYKTAEMVNAMPTIKEKIDLVSPYERPWTRAERTWRRDWHPTLMATRKAWGIPPTPAHFDTLDYYKYITKTRVENKSLDDFYHGLRPPTAELQQSFQNTLKSMEFGDGITFSEEDTQKLFGCLIDDAMGAIAHNVSRLADHRVAYDVESEAFWVRSGFMFLYDEPVIGSNKDHKRRLNNFPKFIGDDRRKLGELAFVHRDKLAAQIRSREPPALLHSLDSDDAKLPVFEKDFNIEETLYSPKVFNLWPDQQPLWQCPGYHADSGETHSYGLLSVKSLRPLRERVAHWMGWESQAELEESPEAKQMIDDGARSQAVISMFTTLCAQAHTHGFTQYTDVTRPFTSQMILSDGLNFYFAVGQLNTLAINVDCEGFVNPRTNFIQIDGPHRLFEIVDEDGNYTSSQEYVDAKNNVNRRVDSGLNEKVLERVTQMLMKQRSKSFMQCYKLIGPPLLLVIGLVVYNEYYIFYSAISHCNWPCEHGRCSETSLKAFMISDTHLLGKRNGHWLDKLKREWQMYQSYQIAKWILNPEVVFFLGDLMDEGKWAEKSLFSSYANRFRQLFGDDKMVITLAGNHDIGFHYAVMPDTLDMFRKEFQRGLIDDIQIKNYRFVLINSMAMHGDGCRLCHEAEVELDRIKNRSSKTRPIVLQHFPLYRKSDAVCEKMDEQHVVDLKEKYREQWDTLSKDSTRKLISTLNPIAVFDGHTHKMCKKKWKSSQAPGYFYEYTVNSFSWRNGDVPSVLLAVMDGEDAFVNSCRLPSEAQQIKVYVVGGLSILILAITLIIRRRSIFKRRCSYSLLMYRSPEKCE
ncbi:hypothetical protein L3Y34_015498 [Caenorhabditis briggsae]|uniref:Metallophosphoesterase 1 homolog n=5 Tax=Caenorhabditis briggsae TaxID=6238 RepID=A0AAE9DWT3_CAEBR|nr:hypothetical protein L3Y34_015498 [Caenorhabditis briggsae]